MFPCPLPSPSLKFLLVVVVVLVVVFCYPMHPGSCYGINNISVPEQELCSVCNLYDIRIVPKFIVVLFLIINDKEMFKIVRLLLNR